MNRGKYSGAGAGASNTSALYFGGNYPPGDNLTAETEFYNGSSWTELADLNTARQNISGNGVKTSALAFGGFIPPGNTKTGATESWNDTSWSNKPNLGTPRINLGTAGVSNTSILAFGGDNFTPPNPNRAQVLTEKWDGSSWTEVADLNNKRSSLAGSGTVTAALAFGGSSIPGNVANTEQWNETSWTNMNNMNTARNSLAGDGTTPATLAFGGATPSATGVTELWNGVAWSEQNDLNSARSSLAGAGTTTAGLAMGGSPTAGQTEEWNVPSNVVKTITD